MKWRSNFEFIMYSWFKEEGHSTGANCQYCEVKKWIEWTKRNPQEKEREKKNKNTGYFEKQCLPACHWIKTRGGTKQEPAEPHVQRCGQLQGSAPQIIPSEQSCTSTFLSTRYSNTKHTEANGRTTPDDVGRVVPSDRDAWARSWGTFCSQSPPEPSGAPEAGNESRASVFPTALWRYH